MANTQTKKLFLITCLVLAPLGGGGLKAVQSTDADIESCESPSFENGLPYFLNVLTKVSSLAKSLNAANLESCHVAQQLISSPAQRGEIHKTNNINSQAIAMPVIEFDVMGGCSGMETFRILLVYFKYIFFLVLTFLSPALLVSICLFPFNLAWHFFRWKRNGKRERFLEYLGGI